MKPAAVGIAAGVAVGGLVAVASRGPSLVEWPDRVRTAFPFVLGGLVGVTTGLKTGMGLSLLRGATGRGPGPITTVAPVVVGASVLGGIALAGTVAGRRAIGGLAATSRALDPGFAIPPADPAVTGGPGSMVAVTELGREGARFVGSVSTA